MLYYPVKVTSELNSLLKFSEHQKMKIDDAKLNNKALWKMIRFKLKADWTYNSNAIEGSTLTLGDTIFFLQEGLTVQGKPFKDHLDAQNHAEAIDALFEVISQDRPISTGFIKEINALLLHGVKSTPAMTQNGQQVAKVATPSQYKIQPNHVLQSDGSLHRYVEPIQIASEMTNLIEWIEAHSNRLPAPFVASVAHYNMVRIHPFDDGNGRGARILMNLILMRNGFIPAVIKNTQKQAYYEALRLADEGNLMPFIFLVTQHLIETQESVLHDFQQ